jgi:hypothetical protein
MWQILEASPMFPIGFVARATAAHSSTRWTSYWVAGAV